jgi:hypothetical protein
MCSLPPQTSPRGVCFGLLVLLALVPAARPDAGLAAATLGAAVAAEPRTESGCRERYKKGAARTACIKRVRRRAKYDCTPAPYKTFWDNGDKDAASDIRQVNYVPDGDAFSAPPHEVFTWYHGPGIRVCEFYLELQPGEVAIQCEVGPRGGPYEPCKTAGAEASRSSGSPGRARSDHHHP